MGFWSRLMGKAEQDTTVTDFQARVAESAATGSPGSATGTFRMVVEDVFTITGRGTVATGSIESGRLAVGDTIEVRDLARGTTVSATVTGIEAFRKRLKVAEAGEMVGLLLDGVGRDDLQRGSVLAKP